MSGNFLDFKYWLNIVLQHFNAIRLQVKSQHALLQLFSGQLLGRLLVIVRHLAVSVALVNERLEIPNFDRLPRTSYHRVQLDRVDRVPAQQTLDSLVVKQFLLGQSKNLEGLLLGNEAALDSQALVGHLLAALVGVLLEFVGLAFLLQEALHALKSLVLRQGPNH